MAKDEKDIKDNKAIEEKALNYFKAFIEDSKVISQFIADNDKEPCWDGFLNLYSDGMRDKKHLLGRVPVQIKGIEVTRFVTKGWKFKLEKLDLKAYLHEPTFFIVCQVKKDSKERKLFYRELLPNLVNKLLKDMGGNDTRKTLFHPLTENLHEFENQLKVFMGNSKKMVSFADSEPMSMADAVKKGYKDFSFIAPIKFSNQLELLRYLSTHGTYLYAKISKELNIDMPLSDGPAKLSFMREDPGEVKVGDRVFYNEYKSKIKEGRYIITIGDALTINLPLDKADKVGGTVKYTSSAKYLKEAIKEAEFVITLNEVRSLNVGHANYQLDLNERNNFDDLQRKLAEWRALDAVLDKLHVTKPLNLDNITKEEARQIDLLIETIGKGKTVKVPGLQSSLLTMKISNVTLLLWCGVGKDDECAIGDFFDKTIRIAYNIGEKEPVNVSPFSYLQLEKFWERIDNIDYDSLVESAKKSAEGHVFCYEMANYDVLAMITASDAMEKTDVGRSQKLLDEALKLNEWLMEEDPKPEMKTVHLINKLQIYKRRRDLKYEEKAEMETLLFDEKIDRTVKLGVYLLMDRRDEAMAIFETLSKEDQKTMMGYPIWRYAKLEPCVEPQGTVVGNKRK